MEYSEDFPSFPNETTDEEMTGMGEESLGLGFGHNDMIGGGKETEEDGEAWEEDDGEDELEESEENDFVEEEI